ncbi:uncharacterized protein LOC130780679 [Actinidia eriantha]|uniref:uncharacterized protein LOC130780679 n=1 Tax=Actinidia eriantha TaxID=165200 RepID=UPI00258A205E|nr:uncharacterized protein LOC130780679 [Actinidia eriantha]
MDCGLGLSVVSDGLSVVSVVSVQLSVVTAVSRWSRLSLSGRGNNTRTLEVRGQHKAPPKCALLRFDVQPWCKIGNLKILVTAGDGALPMLYNIMESGVVKGNANNEQVVWLHLGVNSGAVKFAIERQAANEATFRCPEEFGWQPQQLPIIHEDGGISRTRETSCSVEAILRFLKKKGFDVTVSDDAGRFVCNYVYYHSLRFAQQRGHKSLFVHVPLFSRIDEETQMQFAAALLEAIHQHVRYHPFESDFKKCVFVLSSSLSYAASCKCTVFTYNEIRILLSTLLLFSV